MNTPLRTQVQSEDIKSHSPARPLAAALVHHFPQSCACKRTCTPAVDPHLESEGLLPALEQYQKPLLGSDGFPNPEGAGILG